MFDFQLPTTAARVAAHLGAELSGDPERAVERLSALDQLEEGALAYLSDRKYVAGLARAKGGVVITKPDLVASWDERRKREFTLIVAAEPQRVFAQVAAAVERARRAQKVGISPLAVIEDGAEIGEGASVGPYAVIERGARIGPRAFIGPQVYIAGGVTIGEDCELLTGAAIFGGTKIGDRAKIFAGTVIGSAGFGLYYADGLPQEMPQLGGVTIGNDVRIGANCTIDRGTLSDTRIGDHCKLDDQVHVAHNVRIGRGVVLCAQSGVAGSATVEDSCVLGGQVGVGDGVTVGKGAMLGGQCGTTSNLKGGRTYFMTPALPIEDVLKLRRLLPRLPELAERVRKLEGRAPGKDGESV